MLVPARKPGDNEYRFSFDKGNGIATQVLFAKDEAAAKKTFKTYVGTYEIRNIKRLS